MTEAIYIDTTEVAKMIRKALKQSFPAAKFSVKSDRYSGGSSINVDWRDGPTEAQVKAIIGKYHGSTFDGMIDLKSYHDSMLDTPTGPQKVHFGNDYLFTKRHYSSISMQAAIDWYLGYWGNPERVTLGADNGYGAYVQGGSYSGADRLIYSHLAETTL